MQACTERYHVNKFNLGVLPKPVLDYSDSPGPKFKNSWCCAEHKSTARTLEQVAGVDGLARSGLGQLQVGTCMQNLARPTKLPTATSEPPPLQ